MIISVEIPDQFKPTPRKLLEAYLLKLYAEGELTSGMIAKALDVSWHEAEKFLHDNNAPPGWSPEGLGESVANFQEFLHNE